AYMEDAIRKAGGAKNFEAIITYPNTETQITSRYQYTYTIKGNVMKDECDKMTPDEENKSLGLTRRQSSELTTSKEKKGF
ncbi:DNA/RNA non-specific endonuclease, partial [Streptococcus hyovaginalis]